MENNLPFSQACENNKLPILEILQRHLSDKASVLEVAGGTGQHAVFFAGKLPHLRWFSSDVPAAVATLNIRIALANLPNLPQPIAIDANDPDWNCAVVDAIYSANSFHIMSSASVEKFFGGVGLKLREGGLLLVYGPFKYRGEFTTPSNVQFDLWLKDRNPLSGVRDFEWLNDLAANVGMEFLEDNPMPANNQLLVWRMMAS